MVEGGGMGVIETLLGGTGVDVAMTALVPVTGDVLEMHPAAARAAGSSMDVHGSVVPGSVVPSVFP